MALRFHGFSPRWELLSPVLCLWLSACQGQNLIGRGRADGGVHDSADDGRNKLDVEHDSVAEDDGGATPEGGSDAGDAGPAADFSCVGSVSWPTPASPTYTFFLTPTDFVTGAPIVGATIKICATSDAACASPSATYTTDLIGDARVTAPSSPAGIDGYAELSASGYETTLTFIFPVGGGSILGTFGGAFNPVMFTTSTFAALTGSLGGEDPTRGSLAFLAHDCSGAIAAGVSGSVSTADSKTVTGYFAGGSVLSLSETATQTDSSGKCGIVNIPPGPATLTSTIASSGKTLGTQPIVIRAGADTQLNAMPTP